MNANPTADPPSAAPLTAVTLLTSLPSLVVGAFLVVAISVSTARGDEDEWGIGPFFLGFGLVLLVAVAAAVGMAVRGRQVERTTARRSVWSVVGLGLAIVAAVPSGLLLLLVR